MVYGDDMKKIIIFFIKIYQHIPGPWHSTCRHIPTCSNYTIDAINEYGIVKGTYRGIKRILRCNPLGTYGYDPVKVNNKKETK